MFHYWKTLFATRLPKKSEKGQDLAEYALLIALIALVVIVAVTALGANITEAFNQIAGELPVAP